MASWSRQRKSWYIAGTLAGLLVIGSGSFFLFFYQPPSCADGVQNADELGVDCGGACDRLCAFQVTQPAILWSRSFKVVDGVYNAVAYLDNANSGAVSGTLAYIFRLFDADNILIAERKGITRIDTTGIVPVFEGSIETGNREPARTFFEVSQVPTWDRLDYTPSRMSVSGQALSDEATAPRITATLTNATVEDAFDIEVVVVVFDKNGNAIAGSRTAIDRLSGRGSVPLVFTWPEPFPAPVSKIDIIARSLPQG